ncbi:MAG: alpha-ketoacid dehydrogenase subunit beta, partial [Desulfobacterales bacterium]
MSDRILSCTAALAEALHEEMSRDETIFIIGEDLTAHAGVFGQFEGIFENFPDRIIDTPISETAIAGVGLGSALTGMRPFVDLHFSDFVTCCMDELTNQTAKIRYMFGGQVNVPMVIWCPDGAGLSAAAQHSQSLEAWFVHTPGLKVVVPSEPADVKGLIKAAIRDDDPVIFFQHKKLFAKQGPVPEGDITVPLGRAAV